MITFTKEQLSAVMCKHAEKENGLHDLLEIMLESLMVADRDEFFREWEGRNKGNGVTSNFESTFLAKKNVQILAK
ncbi:MAG: hypothetical protein GX125_02105 [Bacteroidales bacterium]|jgi:hypothetical protein|nr:hypothetical protein [Bacteroidales bacterium]